MLSVKIKSAIMNINMLNVVAPY